MRVAPYTVAALLAAGLALPAAASAQTTIEAIDGVTNNRWSAPDITVKVGETVTWSFAGTTLMHNVKASSPNWTLDSPFAIAGPSVTQTFTAAGQYAYLCQLHASTMTGVVKVTDDSGAPPPPPPPPPLSEQPYANDAPPLTVFERRDTLAPKLDRVDVTRVRRGVRVRFRLSEDGKLAVRLTRGGRTVKTRTVEVDAGTGALTVSGLRAGTYGVQVSAKDLAGNAAKTVVRETVTVRR